MGIGAKGYRKCLGNLAWLRVPPSPLPYGNEITSPYFSHTTNEIIYICRKGTCGYIHY